MLKVKAGVMPRILIIAAAAVNAAEGMGVDIVITAGIDGKHMINSKHFTYEALDLRRSNIPAAQLLPYTHRLQARLGSAYQVILEVDHIHVEYDPPVML